MFKKFVKDRNHNRFPAYCCEDIDKDLGTRVKELEEALAGLVAGIMPDGSVTLAKLADDARTYVREINKGRLLSEWVGTQEEYAAHIAANGGEPLANVRYTIADKPASYAVKAGSLSAGAPKLNSEKKLTEGTGYYYIKLSNNAAFGVLYWEEGKTTFGTAAFRTSTSSVSYFHSLTIASDGTLKAFVYNHPQGGWDEGNGINEITGSVDFYTVKIGE